MTHRFTRSTALLILLAVTACSHAQTTSRTQAANMFMPGASDESPMYSYGRIPKTPAQLAADDKFVRDAIALKGSKEAASDEAVKLGFDYLLQKHDPNTAMKCFNEAYLLDPDNGADYQGMAITVLTKTPTATAQAEDLFKRGIASKRVNPDVFADYGRFLLMQNRSADAVSVLEHGVSLAPDYVETNSLLAEAYYANNQKVKACPLAKRWKANAQPNIAQGLATIVADPVCK